MLVPTITNGNLLSVRQAHQMNGHSFSKLEVFAGKLMLGVVGQADAVPTYVLPAGTQAIWGRLWYDGSRSVDSAEQEMVSADNRSPSWAYTVPGEKKLPLAVSSSDDTVAVTGDGQFFAHRTVAGDFTVTARIEDLSRSTSENGIAANSLMGLLACGHPEQLMNQDHGFGLWDTAGMGMRGTGCDRDLETSGLSRWPLDNHKPWIRITKEGRLWRGFTSADGLHLDQGGGTNAETRTRLKLCRRRLHHPAAGQEQDVVLRQDRTHHDHAVGAARSDAARPGACRARRPVCRRGLRPAVAQHALCQDGWERRDEVNGWRHDLDAAHD